VAAAAAVRAVEHWDCSHSNMTKVLPLGGVVFNGTVRAIFVGAA
jgi:hypothetical protein